MSTEAETLGQGRGRALSWPVWLAFVVVYLAIIQGVGLVLTSDLDDKAGTIPSVDAILRGFVIPIGLSMAFTIGLASWLGWWPQIWHEDRRVRRWVRIVPVVMLVAAVVACDYVNLLDQRIGLVLLLVLTVAMVGFTEELMFRGIGLNVFRRAGLTEGRVALWSSLVFGAVHLSNAIGTGGSAIVQAVVVSLAGYFFYLTRRVGGGIGLAMVVHAAWDFALLSPSLGDTVHTWAPTFIPVLALVFLAVRVFVGRHKIEPAAGETT